MLERASLSVFEEAIKSTFCDVLDTSRDPLPEFELDLNYSGPTVAYLRNMISRASAEVLEEALNRVLSQPA